MSGSRLNEPATGYIACNGAYVIRNDRTGVIVEVSDRSSINGIAFWRNGKDGIATWETIGAKTGEKFEVTMKEGVKRVPSSTLTKQELISGLPAGTKITPEDVINIRKLADGRTVWLEIGSDAAGLQHIYKQHEVDFMKKGILQGKISTVVMNALERGKIIETDGAANVYRIIHNGIEQNIAIGVSSNGFVVRANPVSFWKPLP